MILSKEQVEIIKKCDDMSYCIGCRLDTCDVCDKVTPNLIETLEQAWAENEMLKYSLKTVFEELDRYKREAEKIYKDCRAECMMGKDIKLMKREVADYPPYEKEIYKYNSQIKNCPQICPKYKEVLDEQGATQTNK